MTRDGRVLAFEMVINIEGVASVLRGGVGAVALEVNETVRVHPSQRVIVIGTSDNWYDFILYYLPRLLAVLELGAIEDGWSVALGGGKGAFFRLITELLSVPAEQVIWLEADQTHFFPRAIYLSNMNSVEGFLHPLSISLLQESFLERISSGIAGTRKGIFVSRAKVERRRMLNEHELYPGLTRRGFSIIHPETLSLTEQVDVFRAARDVVGVHGAGLVNAVWSKRLERILEISYAPHTDQPATLDIAVGRMTRSLGAEHRFIRATNEETISPGNHMGDFTVDPERFFIEFDAFMQREAALTIRG
jgi:capsular polysaccharide biosynthesis protein